jgi:hypothetical protein
MKINLTTIHFFIMACIVSSWVMASENPETEYKSMDQMLTSIHLEKKQVESMLDKMVDSGRISAEDSLHAKREIASMKDSDLENLKTQAIAAIKNNKSLDH